MDLYKIEVDEKQLDLIRQGLLRHPAISSNTVDLAQEVLDLYIMLEIHNLDKDLINCLTK